MNRDITIDIRKTLGINGTENQETISSVREFGVNHDSEDFLLVKFSVRESGSYEIHVQYQGAYLDKSPLIQRFLPSILDSDKSMLIRKCPTMICVSNAETVMLIEARDRFGNYCRVEDLSVADFVFQVTHVSHDITSREYGK